MLVTTVAASRTIIPTLLKTCPALTLLNLMCILTSMSMSSLTLNINFLQLVFIVLFTCSLEIEEWR
jgi:hypothetical protein